MRNLRLLPLIILLPGCYLGDRDGGGGDGAVSVSAQIASVALASDCASQTSPSTKRSDSSFAGICATGTVCPGFCQQSGLQLTFTADPARPNDATSAHIELVTVRVFANDQMMDEVAGRDPQVFSADHFVTWNEQVAAGSQVRASYKLAAPNWVKIGGGEEWKSYGMKLQVEVVLRIDGELRTLRSGDLTREPMVVT